MPSTHHPSEFSPLIWPWRAHYLSNINSHSSTVAETVYLSFVRLLLACVLGISSDYGIDTLVRSSSRSVMSPDFFSTTLSFIIKFNVANNDAIINSLDFSRCRCSLRVYSRGRSMIHLGAASSSCAKCGKSRMEYETRSKNAFSEKNVKKYWPRWGQNAVCWLGA